MKRKIIKALLFTFVICTMTVLTLFSVSAKTVTKNKLVYETSGSTATLVECKTNAKSITVPSKVGKYKVTAIGEKAFLKRTKLKSITLPSTVTEIGKSAFNGCTALKKIEIPSSVKKISASAFSGCTKLKTAFIHGNVKSFGKNVFKGCKGLTVYVVSGSKTEKHVKKQSGVTTAYIYMTSLKLNKASVILAAGESITLTATKTPAVLYNGSLTYSSSNPDVVTVTAGGALTAKGCGTAVITCSSNDGSGKKATCTVTVKPVKVGSVKVSDRSVTGYTLSWTATKGSTGYTVSRYNSSTKTWTKVGNTSKTSYTFSSRPLGSTESYRVTAYAFDGKNYYYADNSSAVSASVVIPSAITNFKAASVTDSSVSLSWSKANGATGYKIYVYNPATNTYEYRWATEGLKATISGLDANKSYSFAIKAYVRTAKSMYECKDNPAFFLAKTLPGTVSEITVKEEDIYPDRLTLNWNKVEGADGYNIYIYSKSTGTYELYKRVSGNNSLSADITGLNPDTAYNFKIKTFRGTSEGSWSKVFAFRTDYIPNSGIEGANSFIDALSQTKTTTSRMMLNKEVQTVTENEEDEAILSYIIGEENGLYVLEEGRDTVNGMTLSQLVEPFSEEVSFTSKHVNKDKLSSKQDGYGYSLSFTVDSDKAFELLGLSGFEKSQDFTLLSFEAQDGEVQTKITDGKFDLLKVSVPVKLGFISDGNKYEISFTVSHSYNFIFM